MQTAIPPATWPTATGEMSARIRDFDWAATEIGPIERWPQSLKIAVAIGLDSAFPTFVWWGTGLIQLYNDAAVAIHREKHPAALGRPVREVWADVWSTVGPLFDRVLATGVPFTAEDLAMVTDRGGPREEAFFTFCYSALRDDDGVIAGMQAVAIETTGRVRAEAALRESEGRLAADLTGMRRLYDLHARLATESDLRSALEQIVAAACEVLGTDRGCVQLVSEDGERLEMFAMRGYGPGSPFVEHFMHEGSEPACDAARRDRVRLVIEDVATFPPLAGTRDREVALAEGIYATQSTPMVSRNGELQGVLSNQFRSPHRPSEEQLKFIDLLAWTAADFVSRHKADTALRASEARQAFLLRLSDALRPHTDAVLIQALAARLLGELLGVDRAGYGEIVVADGVESFRVTQDYRALHTTSIAGIHSVAAFGAPMVDAIRTGQTLAVTDVGIDDRFAPRDRAAYVGMDARAFVTLALIKDGRAIAMFGVHQRLPRAWTPNEVALVEETAERTWAAVERAHSERALREREERYRTLFESIDEGYGLYEVMQDDAGRPVDFRVLDVNPAYERLLRRPEAAGKRLTEIAPDVSRDWVAELAAVAESGTSARFERYNEVVDRWFDLFVAPVNRREQSRLALVFNDITERVRATAALRDSEARFRGLAETAPQIVWESTDQAADYFNPRWFQYTGLDAVASSNEGWHLVVHPDDLAEVIRRSAVSARTGEDYEVEYRLRRVDGAYRWHIARAVRMPETGRWTGTATDIHDLKTAQEALRQSEERFRLLGETLPLIVSLARPDGGIDYVNPYWQIFSGRTAEAFVSGDWLDAVHPDDREAMLAEWQGALAASRPYEYEFRARAANGSYRWLMARGSPVFGPDGDLTSWINAAVDVHDARVARDELEARDVAATAELRALSRRLLMVQEEERRHLARELHDEIGQMLTGLGLQLGTPASDGPARLADARAIVAELTQQVRQLSMDLRPATLDAYGLLSALHWQVERYQQRTGIAVDLRHEGVERRFPAPVEIAAYRIVQEALTNIARHAAVDGASVQLFADEAVLTVVIRDGGKGFDSSTPGGGSGLGGMRERAHLLGGSLAIDAVPGAGVVVTAELPFPGPDGDGGEP